MPLVLSGDGAVGPLSATEVSYLDGVTSAVQTQLNGKAADSTQGLYLIKTQAFSAASSVNVDNCFSATYDNYMIVGFGVFGTASGHTLRLRVGGVDSSGNDYRVNGAQSVGATLGNINDTSLSYFYASAGTSRLNTQFTVFLSRPAIAAPTGYTNNASAWDATSGNAHMTNGGFHVLSTAYDGFSLSSAQTCTGTVRVYGYKN